MATEKRRQVGAPGPNHPLRPADLVRAVVESLEADGQITPATLEQFAKHMRQFASFCLRYGARAVSSITPALTAEYVRSRRTDGREPSRATMHVRRGAVRMLFREGRRLGLATGDPSLDLRPPPRSSLVARPLTDDEIALCRAYALDSLTGLRRPLAWALSEATGRTSEIHRVRIRDIDLDRGRVFLHGAPRVLPRWALLTPWGAVQVHRRLDTPPLGLEPDDRLIVWRSKEPRVPRAASSMAVIETIRAAGLHTEADVRPRSVVAWAGQRLLREGAAIDQVARSLGCRTLDQAAEMIGFDWRSVTSEENR